jgi:glycosyltransferase involved in cell wall biosynthesis
MGEQMSFGGFRPWSGKGASKGKSHKLGKHIHSPAKQGQPTRASASASVTPRKSAGRLSKAGRATPGVRRDVPSRAGAATPSVVRKEEPVRNATRPPIRKEAQHRVQAKKSSIRTKASELQTEVLRPRTPIRPPRSGTRSVPRGGQTVPAPFSVEQLWGKRSEVWASNPGIIVSAVLSIHNRSKLFSRALLGYLWQTLPPEKWEIILLDDMSTEDLSLTYQPYIGKMNLRHVRVDHRKFPLWGRKNPGWEPGKKENWYHTPALTINLGAHLARGPVICLCHPEILHAPENLERAAIRIMAEEKVYLFGTTFLGTQEDNRKLDGTRDWRAHDWAGFQGDHHVDKLQKYTDECYWYTSFLPRAAFRKIGGVDFEYLKGVAGEDDDFRERVRLAGYIPIHAPELSGFHQDHSDESERHRKRDTSDWFIGLETNRATYYRRKAKGFPAIANQGTDWTASDCFVDERRYTLGNSAPELFTSLSKEEAKVL